MKKIRVFAIVALALLVCVASFAAAPKLHKTQVLTFNNSTEPQYIDPGRSTGIPESNVETALFEGLTRNGVNDVPEPGVAERWTVSKDNLVYTFYLRKNAKWSNGDPVTAKDFEYSWKRTLDPKLASEYAYQLYYIKNGEAYNTGKIKDANQLGVKVINDYTLQVTLEAPCPYFTSMTAFHTLFPVHRKFVEANPDRWFATPETCVGNGPFKLVSWSHQERLEFAPNPYYWNKNKVKLTKLVFLMIEEQSAALTTYDSGQIDFIDHNSLPRPEIPRLQSEKVLKTAPYLGVYYYRLNVKTPPLNDVRVRRALAMAIDRAALVKYVTKAAENPAIGLVPGGVPDAEKGKTFRQVGGTSFYKDADYTTAKKLLAEAGFPDGKGFPVLEILYNTSETHKQMAEAIQEMWKKNLNIEVSIINQEWQVYLDSMHQITYKHVLRSAWIGDYVDPMTFMDMFVTNGTNNCTNWGNAQYDKLIDTAKNTANQQVRMKAMHDAEKILMDEMPIIPIYFYTDPYLEKSWVKGVRMSAIGPKDFSAAYILAH